MKRNTDFKISCLPLIFLFMICQLSCTNGDDDNNDNDDFNHVMKIAVDEPEDGSSVSLEVTFSWHLVDSDPGETYDFILITDKGIDPCDGSGEDTWDVGEETSITVSLDEIRYLGSTIDWAVIAIASDDTQICSEIRTFSVI